MFLLLTVITTRKPSLDYRLQPLEKMFKSYIKDMIHFLKNVKELGILRKYAILCTIDVVTIYPSTSHEESLDSIRKHLGNRENKKVISGNLVEYTVIVLKKELLSVF